MITAARLREILQVDSLRGLVAELGYVPEEVEIDLREWKAAGLDLGLSESVRASQLVRQGSIRIFGVEGIGIDAEHLTEAVGRLTRFNALIHPLILAHSLDRNLVSIAGPDLKGTIRRIDVDLERPRQDVLERLMLLDGSRERSSRQQTHRRLASAFDRGSVSHRFLLGFRSAAQRIREELRQQFSDEPEEAHQSEAILILSRVLFLYFIQERGWLDHDPAFLPHRVAEAVRLGKNAWRRVLVPLFFGCLNRPVHRRSGAALGLGHVPYLNGGLFERSDYESRHRRMVLSNELLRDVIETVFERYVFTIREDDPSGAHLDPETLGRVFESLMESDERASSGTFYTPRPIVDVLVRRAIAHAVSEGDEEVEALILSDEDPARLPRERLEAIRTRLEGLTILDPACGSGAFLLASLSVIETLCRRTDQALGRRSEPDLRQRIVERSLFGVDLKPEAVRLCELRLWLAIVSGRIAASDLPPDIERIPPLPNLDRNVLQGNSLLGPLDFAGGDSVAMYRQWRSELDKRRDLLDRYRHASIDERPRIRRALQEDDQRLAGSLLEESIRRDQRLLTSEDQSVLFGVGSRRSVREHRAEIAARLADTEERLAAVRRGEVGFFAYDLHFAQVMANGGFDVVVGNPPWVRRGLIPRPMRRMIEDRYRWFGVRGRGFDQCDLSVAFLERAIQLARAGGAVSCLVPSKLLSAFYGRALRSDLERNHRVVAIDDWSRGGRHFDADTFPVALTVEKGGASDFAVEIHLQDRAHRVPQTQIATGESGSPWSLAPGDVRAILDRLRNRFRPLAEQLGSAPVMGVKTGANDCFFLRDAELHPEGLWLRDASVTIPFRAVARVVRGRDVRRFAVRDSLWMLWPPSQGWGDQPPEWIRRFAACHERTPEQLRLAWIRPEHLGLKVVWKDVSRGCQAVLLPESSKIERRSFPLIPNQTLYCVDVASMEQGHALTAILNSMIFNALTLGSLEQAKDGHFRYFGRTIAAVPLPPLDPDQSVVRDLARISRRAHGGGVVDDDLDRLVAELFGLSERDLVVLRRWVEQHLGER